MPDRKILILGAIAAFVIVAVFGVVIARRNNAPSPEQPGEEQIDPGSGETTLTMWGVFDESSIMQPFIDAYQKSHPGVKIIYSKKQYADYERILVDAIASGEGPDIFTLQNDWLPKHRAKISPIATEQLSAAAYKERFIQSAYDDFVADNKVYAIPLYTDNLALYYNKKIFSDTELYQPPTTWDELTRLIVDGRFTRTAQGDPATITRGSIAIGTHNNIARAQDLLLAMMMQTQTPLISDDHRSFDFNQFRKDPDGQAQYPGAEALDFFASFADPNKENYSWSQELPNSIDAFANGQVAMMLGYNYMAPQITRKNPDLSFAVAPLPQIRGTPTPVTIANYWAYSVARTAKNSDVAWDFLQYLSRDGVIDSYLSTTNRVSPLATTKNRQSSAFTRQAPIARTLYKGNSDEFDKIILDLIQNVVQYEQPTQVSIDSAVREANEMLQRYN